MSDQQNPEFQVYGELLMRLSIVSQLFTARMGKHLEKLGFTVAQFGILNHIARVQSEGKATAGVRILDIADAVEVHQPAVSKTVMKFAGMGLVTVAEDPEDKRSRLVLLSPAGFQALADARKSFQSDLLAWRAEWKPAEAEELVATMRRLGSWLDRNRL